MDRQSIDRRDLHRCAVHESGHLVLLACYGVAGEAKLIHRPSPPELYSQARQYSGRVSWEKDPPEDGRPSIGLAGEVAEMWDQDPDIDIETMMDSISCFSVKPSNSDWEMSGIDPEHPQLYDALEAAINAIRQHAGFLEWCVQQLKESWAVSEDQVETEARRQGVWESLLKS